MKNITSSQLPAKFLFRLSFYKNKGPKSDASFREEQETHVRTFKVIKDTIAKLNTSSNERAMLDEK